MAYDLKKSARTLELYKVLHMLADEAAFDAAKQCIENTEILTDEEEVKHSLAETKAAYDLLARAVSPSFSGTTDNNDALERANVGAVLSPKELLDIAATLRVIRCVKTWREENEMKTATVIDGIFDLLIPNKYFEEKIFMCIKNEEELNDDASAELLNIRRAITRASSKIREKLDSIVRSQSYSKYLQESIITQRDGRYVVPVKSEYKGEFSGIVHDSSASGATLFIEPMAVVEINNDLRVLRLKEKKEIERILSELSSEASTFADGIKTSFNALVKLAVIFAKASLAYKMRAVMPNINSCGKTVLKNARHPLIDKNKVVPVSLELGVGYNSLIITGPNTGGKTVTLKTIGLMTLMALCGMMIPCDDGSEISVFDNILVDIGDEQSIEQSLSTFSAHMVNIVSILNNATPFSLVLLDEVGAGTDPIEGAALARAILCALAKKGCRVAATTHYAELKAYALDTEGVQNASCEFDVTTLKPTYRLLIGVPGRSNAFAISEKLGLDKSVIDEAKNFVSAENIRFENIISALERERQSAEKQRIETENIRRELAAAKKRADDINAQINKRYEQETDKAKSTAMHIIDSARQKAGEMLGELEDLKKSANRENASKKYADAKRIYKSSVNDMLNSANPVREIKDDYVLPRKLAVGDKVRLKDINREGEIVSVKDEKIVVAVGSMKISTVPENIILLEKTTVQRSQGVTGIKSGKDRIAATELDMRGMAADEGIIELDRFIDNAVMCGLNTVTVIHGKGTGVLRTAVQNHLKHHKSVKSFRLGTFGEGESGVTVVELQR